MKINQTFYYILNYKPLLKNYKISNFKTIYCKNFFLFFLLFDFIKNKKNINNVKIEIKKKLIYSQSFLRAPNKYKKAQVKINLIRYKIIFKFQEIYNLASNLLNLRFLNYFLDYFLNYFFFLNHHFFFFEKKKIKVLFDSNIIRNIFLEI